MNIESPETATETALPSTTPEVLHQMALLKSQGMQLQNRLSWRGLRGGPMAEEVGEIKRQMNEIGAQLEKLREHYNFLSNGPKPLEINFSHHLAEIQQQRKTGPARRAQRLAELQRTNALQDRALISPEPGQLDFIRTRLLADEKQHLLIGIEKSTEDLYETAWHLRWPTVHHKEHAEEIRLEIPTATDPTAREALSKELLHLTSEDAPKFANAAKRELLKTWATVVEARKQLLLHSETLLIGFRKEAELAEDIFHANHGVAVAARTPVSKRYDTALAEIRALLAATGAGNATGGDVPTPSVENSPITWFGEFTWGNV